MKLGPAALLMVTVLQARICAGQQTLQTLLAVDQR
jgi:hypothetical protein